jgi:hypothetical protein
MKLLKNNQSFGLWDKAEEDVYMLRGCRSQPMFDKLKDMILSSWTHAGEQGLVDTFQKSYLDNDLFNIREVIPGSKLFIGRYILVSLPH